MARFVILLLLLLASVATASASDWAATPLAIGNQSPVIAPFGLPPAAPAKLLPEGHTELQANLQMTSHHSPDSTGREASIFDGETYRLELALRRRLTPRFEAGLALPLVAHNSGLFDSFIINWHDTFTLPNGGRADAPRDLLRYHYVANGEERLNLTDDKVGFGDLRLFGQWRLGSRNTPQGSRDWALQTSLKLPTGSYSGLLGSGSWDLALALAGQTTKVGERHSRGLYGRAGLVLMSRGEVLPTQQRKTVGFATFGGAWKPLQPFALKVQFDAHSSFFGKSELKTLNSPALQITVGGTVELSESTRLDIGVVEDLVHDASPDVTLLIGLSRSFGGASSPMPEVDNPLEDD